jgi:SAM-dependent methyltransferase
MTDERSITPVPCEAPVNIDTGCGIPMVRGRGSIDGIQADNDELIIDGWILHPRYNLEQVRVHVNGQLLGQSPLQWRPDLAELFPHIPHSGLSGMRVQGRLDPVAEPFLNILAEGLSAGASKVYLQWFHPLLSDPAPIPPPGHLMQRVAGDPSALAFQQIGFTAAVSLINALERHSQGGSIMDVLDWGCGPGRLTPHLKKLRPALRLVGCDIDSEAIEWCNHHIPSSAFYVTDPYPPLPFGDASYDAVLACSVMTHLASPIQRLWLSEIRRVLRKRGLFFASVHGQFAASLEPELETRLDQEGILDEFTDGSLDGISPPGYYRAVFQSPSFTLENWQTDFEVVEYIEAGLACYQDLVVLRSRT